MKPFTLEWWLYCYDECRQCKELANDAIGVGNTKMIDAYVKYMLMESYCRKRILKKGENNETTKK